MTLFHPKLLGSIVLLMALSSCGTLQSLLSSPSNVGEVNVLKEELRAIDEANNRAVARNKMMLEMIAAVTSRSNRVIL